MFQSKSWTNNQWLCCQWRGEQKDDCSVNVDVDGGDADDDDEEDEGGGGVGSHGVSRCFLWSRCCGASSAHSPAMEAGGQVGRVNSRLLVIRLVVARAATHLTHSSLLSTSCNSPTHPALSSWKQLVFYSVDAFYLSWKAHPALRHQDRGYIALHWNLGDEHPKACLKFCHNSNSLTPPLYGNGADIDEAGDEDGGEDDEGGEEGEGEGGGGEMESSADDSSNALH